MELSLKGLDRFENLEGILFKQVDRETEHSPRCDSCCNHESDADVANTYHRGVKHAGLSSQPRSWWWGEYKHFPCYKKRCLILPDTDGDSACTR